MARSNPALEPLQPWHRFEATNSGGMFYAGSRTQTNMEHFTSKVATSSTLVDTEDLKIVTRKNGALLIYIHRSLLR